MDSGSMKGSPHSWSTWAQTTPSQSGIWYDLTQQSTLIMMPLVVGLVEGGGGGGHLMFRCWPLGAR